MDSNDFTSLVLYYGREKYYHLMQKMALEGLAKFPNKAGFRLFNGIGFALRSRVQEAIRELNALKENSELGLASVMTLIFTHKDCNVADKDAIYALNMHLKEQQNSSNAIAFYYAAIFLFLTEDIHTAHEYVEKALKIDNRYIDASLLKCWCELYNTKTNRNMQKCFEDILGRCNGKNIDASLGLVRYFQSRKQFESALFILNKLSVRFPELKILLIEKMKTQLSALDWDHTFETVTHILNLESNNLEALYVKTFLLIGLKCNFKAATITLLQLFTAVERNEEGNNELILRICQLFSRICSRNHGILQLTLHYLDKIIQLKPENIQYLVELGFQQIMYGKIREASCTFRAALNIDNNSFFCLYGLTLTQLTKPGDGIIEAGRTIEILCKLCNNDPNPLLLYLIAKTTKKSEESIQLLIKASDIHLTKLKLIVFNCDYLFKLDPDFMLELISDILNYLPIHLRLIIGRTFISDSVHIALKHCLNLLNIIIYFFPCHINALFMRAKVEFLLGNIPTAMQGLQRIIGEIDATNCDAHLLLAQMQLEQDPQKAYQSLELALSHNFEIRDNPMYHMILGITQRKMQNFVEAQQSFYTTLKMIGDNVTDDLGHIVDRKVITNVFSTSNKVTLYLELINTLREMGDLRNIYESERLLQYAEETYKNSNEHARLIIARAEIMLEKYNVCKAINVLNEIKPGEPYYIQAKIFLANIYLKYQKDRIAFITCFKELAQTCSETTCHNMLGESYMSIQEPDLAIEAYKNALLLTQHNTMLVSKIGRVYVRMHKYTEALKYYHERIKNAEYNDLILDLAELYLKLKQYENASNILIREVEGSHMNNLNIVELQLRTKQLLLLARVHEKSENLNLSIKTLLEARDNQLLVLKRNSLEHSEKCAEQQTTMSK